MKSRLWLSLAFAILLTQVFVTFPTAVWTQNKHNFNAGLLDSWPIFGIAVAGIIAISILISWLVPKKMHNRTLAFAMMAALLVFIQQNILTWNYGILDGTSLDFSKNAKFGLLDLLIWIVGIGTCIFIAMPIQKIAKTVLVTLGFVVTATMVTNILSYGEYKQTFTITEADKYSFSKNKNVLVFMFDAFQMDVFLNLLEENPEFKDVLDGFTIYENNSAVFAKTYPSIPLFLTGKRYQKKEPILDFFNTAYNDSLITDLQRSGWDVGLYPETKIYPGVVKAFDIRPEIMDNVVGGTPLEDKVSIYFQTLDISAFRSVPHHVKPLVYRQGNFVTKPVAEKLISRLDQSDGTQKVVRYKSERNHHALDFESQLSEHGQVNLEEPVFRFFHFVIPHAPFYLNRKFERVKHNGGFKFHEDYSYVGLTMMTSYMKQLKKMGVYDNASIVILSDHGMPTYNNKQFNSQTKSYDEISKYVTARSSAKSILLIKNPGEKHPLAKSQKPISGIDIAPTLTDISGAPTRKYEGKAVGKISEDERRERIFNFYTFTTWDSRYLNDFETFKITGDVRDVTSWTKTGVLQPEFSVKNNAVYEFGHIMSYGQDMKLDSDFMNAFLEDKDLKYNSNYVENLEGKINLSIPLKQPPKADENLRLQIEIYSGETAIRNLLINGKTLSQEIKPIARKFGPEIIVTPEIHQGKKIFNLSFTTSNDEAMVPIRLSTIKLSKIDESE